MLHTLLNSPKFNIHYFFHELLSSFQEPVIIFCNDVRIVSDFFLFYLRCWNCSDCHSESLQVLAKWAKWAQWALLMDLELSGNVETYAAGGRSRSQLRGIRALFGSSALFILDKSLQKSKWRQRVWARISWCDPGAPPVRALWGLRAL